MYRPARYCFPCARVRFFLPLELDVDLRETTFSLLAAVFRVAERVAAPSSNSDEAASRVTCFIVHCPGSLSGRQRRKPVPCRKRPPVK